MTDRFWQQVEIQANNYYGVDPEVAMKFIATLRDHITYVVEAGHKIGVADHQLTIHDDSKWTADEFPAYAKYFAGNRTNESPVDSAATGDDFAAAWLHHIHQNPHHWQHWIFSDGWQPKNGTLENGVMPMPQHYALEMVADWMGASRAYTGSWDMVEWLGENIPRIRVHSATARYLNEVLDNMGYADVVYGLQWGSAVK